MACCAAHLVLLVVGALFGDPRRSASMRKAAIDRLVPEELQRRHRLGTNGGRERAPEHPSRARESVDDAAFSRSGLSEQSNVDAGLAEIVSETHRRNHHALGSRIADATSRRSPRALFE